ncbi:LTA synthase family protein [Laribacter hongkongensis]|uniref:LTA synthase family protein n=1 Tax=Laribacter hongkongensis TaxID=168471 RepID=UPI001EFCE3E9|nr:LTA synthase family protein [Laribacter hongkongensis]MCG9054251.1 LTA synthase family protein [Laribacter hongkongensis]
MIRRAEWLWLRAWQGGMVFAMAWLVLEGIRLVLVLSYLPPASSASWYEWGQAFWTGGRFDAKWLAIWLLPAWLALVLATWLPKVPAGWVDRFVIRCWVPVGIAALLLLGLVNYFYFGFYQSPINAIVFGLFEDDTVAVLQTVWHDYPVIPGVLAWLGLVAGILYGAARVGRKRPQMLPAWHKAGLVVMTLLLAGLARGSLGTFPLRDTDAAVGRDAFVNAAVPNGVQALYSAWLDRLATDLGRDEFSGVRRLGFASPLEAARVLGWQGSQDELLRTLLAAPQPAPQAPRPHVVFALMEAWGRELIDAHEPGRNDTLGRLAPFLQRDDYFPHAISVEHGTFPSLEGLLFDTPVTPLTQSRYGQQPFSFAVTRPFKAAGYRVVFLTSGSGSWRHLDHNLLRQGFDEVLDQQSIRQRFPEAEAGTWGVPDDYMMRYASELLAEADRRGEHLLLFMLSTTNHPPYHTPAGYALRPVDPTALPAHRTPDTALARSILETYQYANDSLGGFLERLVAAPWGQRTIVAATGDHNTRSIFEYPDASRLDLAYGVPILFRVPAALRPADPEVGAWASHRDIFPTLQALALGIEPSRFAGRNLYAPDGPSMATSFVAGEGGRGLMLDQTGAVWGFERPRHLLWRDGRLQPASEPVPELEAAGLRARAGMALADWRVRHAALHPPSTGQD